MAPMTQTTTQRTHPGARLRWQSLATRAVATALVVSTTLAGLAPALPAYADFADGRGGRDILIGKDNDNNGNALIQLPGTATDQSLNNTDIQLGGAGNDVLIGNAGDDVQVGESGDHGLLGGPEDRPGPPHSDVQFGGKGNDVSIWAAGDGSDFFHGGNGNRDAQVVGNIDRDPNGPLGNRTVKLTPGPGYGSGLPSVDVSGLNAQ